MKIYILTGLLCLSSLLCQAQEKRRSIGISIEGNALQLKDRAISRRRYSGGSSAISLAFSQGDSQQRWFVRSTYEKGFYSAGKRFDYEQRRMDRSELRGDLGYLFLLGQRAAWRFFGGGLLSLVTTRHEVLKFTNSKLTVSGALDLGPALSAQRAFQLWHRTWRFEGLISIPLVGYLLRPAYGLPSFEGLGYTSWQTLNDYFRLRAKSKLNYELPSGNAFFLSYEWEYRSFKLPNSSQEAAQRLAVGVLINI